MTTTDLDAALLAMTDAQINAALVRRAQAKAQRKKALTAARVRKHRNAGETPTVTREERVSTSECNARRNAAETPDTGADQLPPSPSPSPVPPSPPAPSHAIPPTPQPGGGKEGGKAAIQQPPARPPTAPLAPIGVKTAAARNAVPFPELRQRLATAFRLTDREMRVLDFGGEQLRTLIALDLDGPLLAALERLWATPNGTEIRGEKAWHAQTLSAFLRAPDKDLTTARRCFLGAPIALAAAKPQPLSPTEIAGWLATVPAYAAKRAEWTHVDAMPQFARDEFFAFRRQQKQPAQT